MIIVKHILLTILFLSQSNFALCISYSDHAPALQTPPNNLAVEKVPQFVVIGFDDNRYSGLPPSGIEGGMDWIIKFLARKKNLSGIGNKRTYDGEPVTVSFYHTTQYISAYEYNFPVLQKKIWRKAYLDGHEAGVHTHSHPNDPSMSKSEWMDEIEKCTSMLTNEYDGCESIYNPINSCGVGIMSDDIQGFRTPYLNYTNETFSALMEMGLRYDCSIEDGFQPDLDGANYFWPYTLNNGSPGHEYFVEEHIKDFDLKNFPGLWELPVYPVIVPPDDKCSYYGINYSLRNKMKEIHEWFNKENGKISGLDVNLWVGFEMTKKEFLATLKYSFDLHYNGNRAPFSFGAHSEIYATAYESAPNASCRERQKAIEEFIYYVMNKPGVRIVSANKVIDWCRDPVALDEMESSYPDYDFPVSTRIMKKIIPEYQITTSSSLSDNFTGDNIVDSKEETYWGSSFADSTPWLSIDFGIKYKLNGIIFKWHDRYYPNSYKVYFSNDLEEWISAGPINKECSEDDVFLSKDITLEYRYIAIVFTGLNEVVVGMDEAEFYQLDPRFIED